MTGGHAFTNRVVRIKGTDDEHNNLYRTEQRSSLGGVTARLDELEKRVSAIAGPSSSETDLALKNLKAEVMILRRGKSFTHPKAEFEDEVETVEKLAEDIALLKKVVTATQRLQDVKRLNLLSTLRPKKGNLIRRFNS